MNGDPTWSSSSNPPAAEVVVDLGELLARCHNQASEFGELMLTPTELVALLAWRHDHPAAAFTLGPGHVVDIGHLTVKVLAG